MLEQLTQSEVSKLGLQVKHLESIWLHGERLKAVSAKKFLLVSKNFNSCGYTDSVENITAVNQVQLLIESSTRPITIYQHTQTIQTDSACRGRDRRRLWGIKPVR